MRLSLFTFLLIFGFNLYAQSITQTDPLIKRLYSHVQYLGSDHLRGRGAGTDGERLAAEYIAKELHKSSILHFAGNNSYFQQIPMHGAKVSRESQLCVFTASDTIHLNLGKDYLLYKTGAQTYVPQPLPLVFCGYGVSAPEFDYDDYRNIDVQGKIAIYLEGEPLSDDKAYFDGEAPTIYSYAESKQRNALMHGAIGSIMIIPEGKKQRWEKYVREFSFEDVTLAYRTSGHLGILMHTGAAQKLFIDSHLTFNQVRKMAANQTLYSFPMKTRLMFRGVFKERDFFSANVIGFLPGLQEKYIIVSAHYDHLGVGMAVKGDSIYNGVMDNAMGVAAVLEIASLFAKQRTENLYGLIFLFVSGEEKGLLGSAYYTDHPVVPLYKTLANVNIDGLAAFDRFKEVVGVGMEFSDLGKIFKTIAKKNNLFTAPVPPQFLSYESFARSDQMSFAWAGIPSILIMDGLNYENLSYAQGLQKWLDWNEAIYHTPFDDLKQPIDWNAAKQHTLFLFDFCKTLANSAQQPDWNEKVRFRNIRLQTIAEKR